MGSGSEYAFAESDDDAIPFSDSKLASIVLKSGGRDLFSRLCPTCKSAAGWFFMDRPTWERASAGCSFVSIRSVSGANPADTCVLCSFLGKLTQGLRAFGLAEGAQGYQLRATTTNGTFSGAAHDTTHYNTPAFCVTPSGQSFDRFKLIQHNAYFVSNSRPQGSEGGVCARRVGPYWDPALVRQWIAFCDAQHHLVKCYSREEDISIPYFCVIDCSTIPPSLVDAAHLDSREYITLSYVWGQEQCQGPREDGRLPRRLPKLIRGVICVTLALGYRYLWIDRYCIPQNDSARRRSLIKDMDKIYERSVVCIVAASASGPRDGLHGVTKPREVIQETVDLVSLSWSQIMSNIKEEVGNSQWNSRGWTYQERVLAKRRLVFTATQCCFQCGEQWFLESLDYPLPSFEFLKIPHPFPDQDPFFDGERQGFDSLPLEFPRRQLSKGSDAVPAITGILNRFHSFNHVSGVPVFDPASSGTPLLGALLEGLTWLFLTTHLPRCPSVSALEALPRRRSGAPSWTWCAWECSGTPYLPAWTLTGPSSSSDRMDFLATTSISVEDVDGKIAQWSGTTMEVIAQKLSTLSEVKYLRVRGWVCDIAIPDSSQHARPVIEFAGHTSMTYINWDDWSLVRLNSLARNLDMRSVNGAFVFLGWVVAITSRWESGDIETGLVMLLRRVPKSQDVERIDMCKVRFQTLPNLSSDRVFLPSHGWTLRSFRIS